MCARSLSSSSWMSRPKPIFHSSCPSKKRKYIKYSIKNQSFAYIYAIARILVRKQDLILMALWSMIFQDHHCQGKFTAQLFLRFHCKCALLKIVSKFWRKMVRKIRLHKMLKSCTDIWCFNQKRAEVEQ